MGGRCCFAIRRQDVPVSLAGTPRGFLTVPTPDFPAASTKGSLLGSFDVKDLARTRIVQLFLVLRAL